MIVAPVLLGIGALCCLWWATPFLSKYAKAITALRNMKGPRDYFLGGILNALEASNTLKTQELIHNWVLEFGKTIKLCGFPFPMVLLASPEHVQKLFGSNDNDHLKKPFIYDPIRTLVQDGLFTSTGDYWRSHRQPMSYINSFKHLQSYMEIFNKESHRMVADLGEIFDGKDKNMKEVEVLHVFTKLALFTVTESLFEKSLSDEDPKMVKELIQGMDRFKSSREERFAQPWLIFNKIFRLSPLSKEVDQVTSKLRSTFKTAISDFKMNMIGSSGLEIQKRPLMNQMLHFSEKGVLDEVATMTMAGYETTGMTLQLLLFFLSLHPEHQEKCREEVDRLLSDSRKNPGGFISQQDLSSLKHIERCIMETLRFFPPVYLLLRHIEAPLKLDDKLTLLPGTQVNVVIRELHMNPELFPEPEVFDPDRFLPEECKKRHPYAYFPFAGGPRKCIGFKFATLQIVVACARILQNFVVTSSFKFEDVKVIAGMLITLEKNIPLNFKRR